MKTFKKTVILPFLLVILLMFCSCTGEKLIDYSELCIRMSKTDKLFCLPKENVFYSNGVYFIYYSLCSKNDVLLTAKEDDQKILTRITITLLQKNSDNTLNYYISMCRAASNAFFSEDAQKLFSECSVYFTDKLFCTDMYTASIKNFSATVVSSQNAVCYILESKDSVPLNCTD